MDKKSLSERDICTKFITPAIEKAGWNIHEQVREEVPLTAGRISVRGNFYTRGKALRADYILSYKPHIPIVVIEAKDNKHRVGDGMQQAIQYAETLDIPFIFTSNGDSFLFRDKTGESDNLEQEIALEDFPSPEDLWRKYCLWKNIDDELEDAISTPYYRLDGDRKPRYYQTIAINRAVEAIARGQDRVLLVMATGTGKTFLLSEHKGEAGERQEIPVC
ncbi:hypothetical protein GC174_08795 [bacterium]|nr:hypothetical protein [bacterium]